MKNKILHFLVLSRHFEYDLNYLFHDFIILKLDGWNCTSNAKIINHRNIVLLALTLFIYIFQLDSVAIQIKSQQLLWSEIVVNTFQQLALHLINCATLT